MDILFVFLRHSLVYPEYPGICHADLANLKTSAKTSCWPYFSFLLSHPVLILLYQSIRFLSAWFIRTNFWKSFWTLHLLLLVNILSFLGQGLMCPRLVLNSFLYSLEFLIILTPWFISSLFSALPHPPSHFFLFPHNLFSHEYVWAYGYHSAYIEMRGKLGKVNFLFSPYFPWIELRLSALVASLLYCLSYLTSPWVNFLGAGVTDVYHYSWLWFFFFNILPFFSPSHCTVFVLVYIWRPDLERTQVQFQAL